MACFPPNQQKNLKEVRYTHLILMEKKKREDEWER